MRKILSAGLLIIVAIQFIPVQRENPPATSEITANPEVKRLLQRACYDCHSNETVWPWYSYVAPVSWLVADDVEHGRTQLNFSEWATYHGKKQRHLKRKMVAEVEAGNMPLWFYLPLHAEAKISNQDLAALKDWVVMTAVDSSNAVTAE